MVTHTQLKLGFADSEEIQEAKKPELSNGRANKLDPQDRAFHDWYRFVLSFPPHLVRDYIGRFGLNQNSVVLDPFCGTGTTLVEAKLAGMKAIGLDRGQSISTFCFSGQDRLEIERRRIFDASARGGRKGIFDS